MSTNGVEHPALAESRKRLAELERRTPPGYPLGYSLHVTNITCNACGSSSTQSELWTVMRAGSAGKSYHYTAPKELVYDLPVDEVRRDRVTARCMACVVVIPREPVPKLPPYQQKLKPGSAPVDADVADILSLFGVKHGC